MNRKNKPKPSFGKLQRMVRLFSRLDTPSFMPDIRVPLWKSILIDWGRLFTLGLWRPNSAIDIKSPPIARTTEKE